MVAPASTYRYGPAGGGIGTPPRAPVAPMPPAHISSAPAAILRRTLRSAWDHEPLLERTRRQLQAEAQRAGIAGATGSYRAAAERTGFALELSRIAGPKETGALAEHFKRAWGKTVDYATMI